MKKNSEHGILYVKNKINTYLFVYIFVFLFLLFILLILNYQENTNFSSTNLAYFNIDIARAVFVLLAICVLCLIRTANISTNFDFPEYYFFYFVSCFASYLMIGADNLINFFLLLELQALLFYLLSAVSGPLKNKNVFGSSASFSVFNSEAALKYFIIGSFASAILFFALSLIYLELGSLSLSDIKVLLSVLSQNEIVSENMFLYKISFTIVILVLLYKSAAAPFHVASPEIYEGAPLATTIIYTTIPKYVLTIFLIRILSSFSSVWPNYISTIILISGVLSIFFGTLGAINQRRLKGLIVYSSIANTGFILLGLSTLGLESYKTSIFYMLVYLVTMLVFWGLYVLSISNNGFLLNSIYIYAKDKLSYFSSFASNIKKNFDIKNPKNILAIIVAFSIAGFPPFGGFFGKLFVFSNIIDNSTSIFFPVFLALLAVVSVYYYLKALKVFFFENKELASLYSSQQKESQAIVISFKQIDKQLLFIDLILFLVCFIILMFFFIDIPYSLAEKIAQAALYVPPISF